MKTFVCFSLLILPFTFFAQGVPYASSLTSTTTSETPAATVTYADEVDTNLMAKLYNSPLYENTPKNTTTDKFTVDILKLRLKNLDKNTPLNVRYNTTVESYINTYLNTRKEDISSLMDKATYYFPIFEEYLDKYDLPLEIKYLAIVESALEPTSKSQVGAKGLWQFMYHTGKQFGLHITSYVDERLDPVKATEAACQYLESLHETFGDWDLALAAYNSGPGNVSKAIRRSGGSKNYWTIRRYLPLETQQYVPAFYATFYLFEYGEKHGIYPKNAAITFFETDTIHVKKKVSFQKIQQEIHIDNALLKKLNPQYKLGIIPATETSNVLTLPKSLIGKFISTEHNIYNIPKKHSISKHIVATVINSDALLPSTKQTNRVIQKKNITAQKKFLLYTVKKGDSLFLISKKFPGVTIHQIRNWNNIWGQSYVRPGTQLKILTITE